MRLIVFDWDGTLMDSEARIVSCIQAAAREMGLAPLARERAREVIGLGLREALERLFPGCDADFREAYTAHYRRHFLELDPTPQAPFPGALETVRALREAGYRVAVATGKSRRGLEQALAETGAAGLFDATRCADETRSKPHPQMLLELMETIGAAPEETLMVGDTEYDMEMARRARVLPVAVGCGVHPPERLLRHRPAALLDDVCGLPAWLARVREALA
ncbi:HAD family hydrolase [Inmirania thermothiophila]|uniref:Phosphoglycolate phosphatase n=1 Tax=Inmirania thermothiophila TaxID=1750597 RepID=A0A3N1Y1E9_9GAMM|nr:HAD-IA family hydrolase [Inmirania thermothiophila]ROR32645.1 phosphoglycolate phosphatase [Inmirania thermothiophila]